MRDAIYFHQTTVGGRVVKLVGIAHPLVLGLDGEKSRKILELVAPADVILTESKRILPKKLAAKARLVDCRVAEKAAREFYSTRVEKSEERGDTLKALLSEMRKTLFPPKLKVRAMPEIERLGKATQGSPTLHASKRELEEFEELVVSLRSFIMLSKLLQKHFSTRNRERTLVLVAGLAHTIQLFCFLDRRGCFKRYSTRLAKLIPRLEIISESTRRHLLKETRLAMKNGRKAQLL